MLTKFWRSYQQILKRYAGLVYNILIFFGVKLMIIKRCVFC